MVKSMQLLIQPSLAAAECLLFLLNSFTQTQRSSLEDCSSVIQIIIIQQMKLVPNHSCHVLNVQLIIIRIIVEFPGIMRESFRIID